MKDMLNRNSVLWSVALLGLLAVGGYVLIQGISPGQGEERSEPAASGLEEERQQAPDFALERLNGERFRLSEHRGTVVVINFWATWCPPCREEIPEFVELQTEMEGEVLFVGVSMDKGDPERCAPLPRSLVSTIPS
jgi:cytochrome c biogenesis protein CcmG/thiol:disulfide interchange protein DsbE